MVTGMISGKASRPDMCDKRRHLLRGVGLVLCWVLLHPVGGWAQPDTGPDPMGYPLFRNYTPEDYGRKIQSQNWSVTQDSLGVIYVANPNGVLIYDSASWRLIPTKKQTLVRTVVTGPSGTVYVGAYGEIGALRPDSTGTLRYRSLLNHVDPEYRQFGHTWSGVATPEGVYFQTRNTIFRWDGTRMRTWSATDSTRFLKIFSVRDTVYVAESGAGLKRLVDGTLQLVPGGARFAQDGVYTVLPYRERLLVGTENGMLYRHDGEQFLPFSAEGRAFLRENELYDGVVLPDSTLAFATLRGGVLLMDQNGRTLQVLDERANLVDDDVKSLFVDRQGGLWAACETGIARADMLAPLSFYDERTGLDGVVLTLERHDGVLHAGTSSGTYRLSQITTADGTVRPQFERIAGLRGQTFDLLSTDHGLLAATEKGIYLIRGRQATPLEEGRTVFELYASRRDESVVYVGFIDGLGTLRRRGDRWTRGPTLRGFDREVHFMGESKASALWVASAYGGLWRIETANGLGAQPSMEQMASENQTPRHVFRMEYFEDGIRIITRTGLAKPIVDEAGGITLEPDSMLHAALPEHAEIVDVKAAPDGDYWVFTGDEVVWLRANAEGGYEVKTPLARVADLSAFTALAEPGGTFWVAGEEGILRHTPRPEVVPVPRIQTLIRRVAILERDSTLFGGAPQGALLNRNAGMPHLAAEHDALRFEFAAPGYGNETANEYQYRLEGFDKGWSDWTQETKKDYTNLPPGEYTFQVRARNPRVWEAHMASFGFIVLPPWYRTVWAYLLYIVLGVGLIMGAVWWRSAHLEARARRLEKLIAQRTTEVQEQAEQLEAYNRELRQTNEALQDALEQKSELLGIAAHDLKNPLFGIRGLSEILLEDADLDASMHRKVQLIHDSAGETLELINDLLESAAASSGQVQLETERLDMNSVAEWLVNSFRPQAEKKGQELAFASSDEDCTVEADEQRLREAMGNLVSNAIKYSPKEAAIEVEVERVEDEVRFVVRDEGPGLSKEEQKNLFAPFQRLSPEPTAGEASSGLGLYIVKQLVEMHGGRVWVESEVGEGSTFTLALPAVYSVSERATAAEVHK